MSALPVIRQLPINRGSLTGSMRDNCCAMTEQIFHGDIIRDFKNAAVHYGHAMECGPTGSATKFARHLRGLRERLLADQQSGMKTLSALLQDSNPWIRYAAAANLITMLPEEARATLEELEKVQGTLGALSFTALRMNESRRQS